MASTSDRLYDLSLRILMICISLAVVACVAFLTYRWMLPAQPPVTQVQLMEVQAPRQPQTEPAPLPVSNPSQVLLSPGQIFRCNINGRLSFSDQPCSKDDDVKASAVLGSNVR